MAQPAFQFGFPTTPQPQTPTTQSTFPTGPQSSPTPIYPPNQFTGQAYGPSSPHGVKRHAGGSPPEQSSGSSGSRPKRRRPNLSNGFQAMSIQNDGQWFPQATADAHNQNQTDDDDDGLEPTQPPLDGDVAVEYLAPRRVKRPRSSWQRNSSFSSTSPDEDDYESDATFRIPQQRLPPMQASSVEHPKDPSDHVELPHQSPHVEYMDTPPKRKKSGDPEQPRKRRREGMDVDMDNLPPEAYGPGWYEPEKDRIVVTDLSPEGSRSPSPETETDKRRYSLKDNQHLAQPGHQGFTISPSLLTHILNAQRDQFANSHPQTGPERGLVLYRPIPFNNNPQSVVEEWSGAPRLSQIPDSGRFEEVDDDEDLSMDQNAVVGVPVGMEMDSEGGWGAAAAPDDAMDVE